jgi:uncharacterized RDD family membrane protein YckC
MSAPELDVPMGQCAVTGKMVPEDELVTIQGQRVCAEGKAILLERLKAGDAMPGEFEIPSVRKRFRCIFVDGLIIGLPFSALIMVLARGMTVGPIMLGIVSAIGALAAVIYFGQLHGMSGQSVGKKLGKLRVVTLEGGPITLQTGYVRAIAFAGPGILTGLAMMLGSPVITGSVGVVVGCYRLADMLFALFDRSQQRALHDRIAGTRVIRIDG